MTNRCAWRLSFISALTAVLVLHFPTRTARADDTSGRVFRLVWVRGDGTENCADRTAIAEGVTRRLGRQVFSEAARRSIEAVVQHEGDVWEAHIYVRDDDGKLIGSRILTSRDPTCTAIQSAVTLAVVLAIDPEAALGPPPPPASPSPAPAAPTEPAPPHPPPPPAPAAPAPTPAPPVTPGPERPYPPAQPPPPFEKTGASATAAFRAIVAFGLLPSTAPGLALGAEVPLYRWLHGTGGILFLPEQRTADGNFAFGMTAAWLGACARPLESSRASLSFCANADAGDIHAVVLALEPLHPGDHAWAGASLGAAFRAGLVGPLEAEIGADLMIPLTRDAFGVKGGPTVFRQAFVTGVAFAGVGMSFP